MKLGIDLTDIKRIQKLLSRNDINALNRIWTTGELEEAKDKNGGFIAETLAAGFACKEAVAKALGTGFGPHGVTASQIEILHEKSGRPYVILSGNTLDYFNNQGYTSIEVSLTHTDSAAAAVCIIF